MSIEIHLFSVGLEPRKKGLMVKGEGGRMKIAAAGVACMNIHGLAANAYSTPVSAYIIVYLIP